jgi:hypothetical protein
MPVHLVEYAREHAERCFERLLIRRIFGEQAQRRSDQRIGFAQFLRCIFGAFRQRNVTRPRDKKTERDRLRIAIGKLRIVSLRKQKLAPVFREPSQSWTSERHCSITSSRRKRQRRALTSASCFAVLGGMGDQRTKSEISGSSVGGADSFAPESSTSPSR